MAKEEITYGVWFDGDHPTAVTASSPEAAALSYIEDMDPDPRGERDVVVEDPGKEEHLFKVRAQVFWTAFPVGCF